MSLKLKEEPREWQKFVVAASIALAVLALVLWRRRVLSLSAMTLVLSLLGAKLLVCLLRPAWFRSYYRAGMTISYYAGQLLGGILLALIFLVALTPLGLLLRLLGKDLLSLKKNATATTYWEPANANEHFDHQF